MRGVPNPPPETILKGKALFRVVAWGVVIMHVRPSLTIRKRKEAARDRDRNDLNKTLLMFSEANDLWIGKYVKVPISSLQHDETLNFDFKEVGLSNSTLKSRVLQCKVRVKSIIDNLVSSGSPPDHIIDFFVTLIEEENYFPVGFLWPHELKEMDFGPLGGTRGMILPASPPASTPSSPIPLSTPIKVKKKWVNALRAKRLFVDFVLIRILCDHCCLSPWYV